MRKGDTPENDPRSLGDADWFSPILTKGGFVDRRYTSNDVFRNDGSPDLRFRIYWDSIRAIQEVIEEEEEEIHLPEPEPVKGEENDREEEEEEEEDRPPYEPEPLHKREFDPLPPTGSDGIIPYEVFGRSLIDYLMTMQGINDGKIFLVKDGSKREVDIFSLMKLRDRVTEDYENSQGGKKGEKYPVLFHVDFDEDTGDLSLNWNETEFPFDESEIDLRDYDVEE